MKPIQPILNHRLNAYRIMWLFVFFDLPTNSKRERKSASVFRKRLLKAGFSMWQYSVYARFCMSYEIAEMHRKRIQSYLPDLGRVSVMHITDKQFSMIQEYFGKMPTQAPLEAPQQLELF